MNNRFNLLLANMMACLLLVVATELQATETDPYKEVAYKRAERIVTAIDLGENEARRPLVVRAVAEQYRNLHRLHEDRDNGIISPEVCEAKVKALHFAYVGQLLSLLSPGQVDLIKDGMTYNVAKNTYTVYIDMFPDLDAEKKARIKAWLMEAREHAMDGGSSDEKHRWFGKYKGKINNYLSALGYDLKQAERDMWERKKTEK